MGTEKQDIVNSSSNLQKSKHKDLYEMQFNGLSLTDVWFNVKCEPIFSWSRVLQYVKIVVVSRDVVPLQQTLTIPIMMPVSHCHTEWRQITLEMDRCPSLVVSINPLHFHWLLKGKPAVARWKMSVRLLLFRRSPHPLLSLSASLLWVKFDYLV